MTLLYIIIVLLHMYISLESESEVVQSCPILCDCMDCNLPGSSVHGIFQARILEWVAMSSSRGSSQPRDRTNISLSLLHWQARSLPLEPPGMPPFNEFCSVQSLSHVQLFVTPWTAACQASLPITSSWSILKLMSIESVMSSNRLILCRPLILPPSSFHTIRVFSNESVLHIS